ncbi:hypothetical protein [Pseudomonas gorinensis]
MTKQAQQTVLAAELPERGQPLAGGVFVTRYWLNGVERALILLPDELSGPWGEYGVEIKGAGSYSDGEANTRAMAEAGSVIAVKALELDGFIPSCLEGQLLMAAKADGLVELREDRWHWLSSQRSANYAYGVDFEDGWLNGQRQGPRAARAPCPQPPYSVIHSFNRFSQVIPGSARTTLRPEACREAPATCTLISLTGAPHARQ